MDNSDVVTSHNMNDIVLNKSFLNSNKNSFLIIDSKDTVNNTISDFTTLGFDQEYWSLSSDIIHNFFFLENNSLQSSNVKIKKIVSNEFIDDPIRSKLRNRQSSNNVISLLSDIPITLESDQKIKSMYTTNPLSISSSPYPHAYNQTWKDILVHMAGVDANNPDVPSLPISIINSLPNPTLQDSTYIQSQDSIYAQNISSSPNFWNLHHDDLINTVNFNLSNTMENPKSNSEEINPSFQNSFSTSDISLDSSNVNSHNVFSAVISSHMNIDSIPMSLSSYLTFPNQDFNLHVDTNANFLASHYGADAVTIGHDVFFRNDQFDTSTIAGFGLLVHELTHISQLEHQNPAEIDALTEERWEREAISNENQAIIDHYDIKSQQTYAHNMSKNSNQLNTVANLIHSTDFHPTQIHHSNHTSENNSNSILTADSERETTIPNDESVDPSLSPDEIADVVYEKILLKIKEQKERRGW